MTFWSIETYFTSFAHSAHESDPRKMVRRRVLRGYAHPPRRVETHEITFTPDHLPLPVENSPAEGGSWPWELVMGV